MEVLWERVVAVDKGNWDEYAKDWGSVLVFDSGARVKGCGYYTDAINRMRAAYARLHIKDACPDCHGVGVKTTREGNWSCHRCRMTGKVERE